MKNRLARCLAVLSLLAAAGASAQTFPAKPIRWLVPYAAGGGSDFLARTVAQTLSTQVGQPVLVDNKPGGNTALAAAETARAPADGYTVLSADNGTLVFNPALYKSLSYSPTKDLAPVTLMGKFPMILVVGANSGIATATDFIARAKARPGDVSSASAGAGRRQPPAPLVSRKTTALSGDGRHHHLGKAGRDVDADVEELGVADLAPPVPHAVVDRAVQQEAQRAHDGDLVRDDPQGPLLAPKDIHQEPPCATAAVRAAFSAGVRVVRVGEDAFQPVDGGEHVDPEPAGAVGAGVALHERGRLLPQAVAVRVTGEVRAHAQQRALERHDRPRLRAG